MTKLSRRELLGKGLAALAGLAVTGCGGGGGGGGAVPGPAPTINPIDAATPAEREGMAFPTPPGISNSELVRVINDYLANSNFWNSALNPQTSYIMNDTTDGLNSLRKLYNALVENATGGKITTGDIAIRETTLNDIINYHALRGEIAAGNYINTHFSPNGGPDDNVAYVLNNGINTYQLLERIARAHNRTFDIDHTAGIVSTPVNDYTLGVGQTWNQFYNAMTADQRSVAVNEAKGYAWTSWILPDAIQFAGQENEHSVYISPVNADQMGRNVFWPIRQAHRQATPGNDANGFLTLYDDKSAYTDSLGNAQTLFANYLGSTLETELTALRQLTPGSAGYNAKKNSIETTLEVKLL